MWEDSSASVFLFNVINNLLKQLIIDFQSTVKQNIFQQYKGSMFSMEDILHIPYGVRLTGITLKVFNIIESFTLVRLFCFLQCLQHKAFHPNKPLPPIEQHLLEMLEMPCVVRERCQAPLERVKALFPLKEVGKKKGEKTAQDIFKDK